MNKSTARVNRLYEDGDFALRRARGSEATLMKIMCSSLCSGTEGGDFALRRVRVSEATLLKSLCSGTEVGDFALRQS